MMRRLVLSFSLICLAAVACGGDGDEADGGGDADADADADGGGDSPAAPSNLEGMVMGDGIHLTWMDNSDDEDEFVVERADSGSGNFEEITREPANSTSYHDGPLNAGTYDYRVFASNAAGESAYAEGTFEMN